MALCQISSQGDNIFVRGTIKGKTIAWIGDSNNVCHTWLQAAAIFDFNVHVSTPPGYEIEPDASAASSTGSTGPPTAETRACTASGSRSRS